MTPYFLHVLWLSLHACLGAIEDVYLDLWNGIANVYLVHGEFDPCQALDAATRSGMEIVLYVGAYLRPSSHGGVCDDHDIVCAVRGREVVSCSAG